MSIERFMDFELHDDGVLKRPYLHDGYVLGIAIREKSSIEITVKDVQENHYQIRLNSVQRFRCEEFLEGNIIFDATIKSGAAPDDGSLRRLMPAPHPLAEQQYHSKAEQYLDEVQEKIKSGDLAFFEITASYGCTVLALCKAIQIIPLKA